MEGIVPVYPCVAPESVADEFCIYRRAGYSARGTKDGYNYEETLNLMLNIVARSYTRSIELAQRVKERLEGLRGVHGGYMIDSLEMTNAAEDYSGDCFVQTLYFRITLDPQP